MFYFFIPIALSTIRIAPIDNIWELIVHYEYYYQQISSFVESRQQINIKGDSSFMINDMNSFYQMFTYLFRPLPFESHNLFSFFASIDNCILLIVFFYSLLNINNKRIKGPSYIFLLFVTFFILFALSKTTPNLGIANRQKWMIMPMLLFLFFSSFSYLKEKIK